MNSLLIRNKRTVNKALCENGTEIITKPKLCVSWFLVKVMQNAGSTYVKMIQHTRGEHNTINTNICLKELKEYIYLLLYYKPNS